MFAGPRCLLGSFCGVLAWGVKVLKRFDARGGTKHALLVWIAPAGTAALLCLSSLLSEVARALSPEQGEFASAAARKREQGKMKSHLFFCL